jgi:glycosyltransferase involved in cell wall biosynthesis
MDRPLIVNGGRLCDNKGFDLLVRTARSVVDRRPDAVFLLTMSYSSSCDQEQASFVELQGLVNDLKLKDNVFLNPSVSKDVYNLIFSSADVVGGTNRFEGFGMYFTEAAAAGVPLVVSKHTGLAQNHLVHETSALIIDPYEFDATADALLRVLSDEVFAQKLRRNAEKVVRSLDWNEIAGQFSEVVDGLLSHPKKPSLNLQNLPGAIIYGR